MPHPPHPLQPPHFPPPLAEFAGQPPPAPSWFTEALADEPQRSHVRVQGAPIETLAWGRLGDPGLLLLHGNSAHADWYSFIAPLVRKGRRVVAFSLSGMGGSGWRTQYSVAQWANEALAVAEATGLFASPRLPTVVAHSFGGFPLINLAARHGQRLAQAVLVDTALRLAQPGGVAQAPRRHSGENLRSARVYSSLSQALLRFRLLPPQSCAHPYIADLVARRGLKATTGPDGQPGWVWRFDPFMFRNFEFGRPYRDLRAAACPVTIVRGSRSRLVTVAALEHALSLAPPGSRRLELADADHHVMIDQPQAFAELLATLVPLA